MDSFGMALCNVQKERQVFLLLFAIRVLNQLDWVEDLKSEVLEGKGS